MKVSELSGVLLDYWCAKADGIEAKIVPAGNRYGGRVLTEPTCFVRSKGSDSWHDALLEYQLEPFIVREKIGVTWGAAFQKWYAMVLPNGILSLKWQATGPTPLVAAMRAYVASKIGSEVPDCPAEASQ